eukprot:IDg6087t1
MKSTRTTLTRRIRIVEDADSLRDDSATASKFNVHAVQIRRWRRNMIPIKKRAVAHPVARSMNAGPPPSNPQLET